MHLFILTLHILGAGILIGLVVITFLIAFRLDFSTRSLDFLNKIKYLGPGISTLQFATGAYLYWVERDEFNENRLFWAKIIVYLIEGSLAGLIIDRKVKQAKAKGDDPKLLSTLRWLYAVHALLIIVITVIGVVIANGEHID